MEFCVIYKAKGNKEIIVELTADDYLHAIHKTRAELERLGYRKLTLVSCRPVEEDFDVLEEGEEWL